MSETETMTQMGTEFPFLPPPPSSSLRAKGQIRSASRGRMGTRPLPSPPPPIFEEFEDESEREEGSEEESEIEEGFIGEMFPLIEEEPERKKLALSPSPIPPPRIPSTTAVPMVRRETPMVRRETPMVRRETPMVRREISTTRQGIQSALDQEIRKIVYEILEEEGLLMKKQIKPSTIMTKPFVGEKRPSSVKSSMFTQGALSPALQRQVAMVEEDVLGEPINLVTPFAYRKLYQKREF